MRAHGNDQRSLASSEAYASAPLRSKSTPAPGGTAPFPPPDTPHRPSPPRTTQPALLHPHTIVPPCGALTQPYSSASHRAAMRRACPTLPARRLTPPRGTQPQPPLAGTHDATRHADPTFPPSAGGRRPHVRTRRLAPRRLSPWEGGGSGDEQCCPPGPGLARRSEVTLVRCRPLAHGGWDRSPRRLMPAPARAAPWAAQPPAGGSDYAPAERRGHAHAGRRAGARGTVGRCAHRVAGGCSRRAVGHAPARTGLRGTRTQGRRPGPSHGGRNARRDGRGPAYGGAGTRAREAGADADAGGGWQGMPAAEDQGCARKGAEGHRRRSGMRPEGSGRGAAEDQGCARKGAEGVPRRGGPSLP